MRQLRLAVTVAVQLVHDLQVLADVAHATVAEAEHPDPADEAEAGGGRDEDEPEPEEDVDLLVE